MNIKLPGTEYYCLKFKLQSPKKRHLLPDFSLPTSINRIKTRHLTYLSMKYEYSAVPKTGYLILTFPENTYQTISSV